jgi:hypothetical protein
MDALSWCRGSSSGADLLNSVDGCHGGSLRPVLAPLGPRPPSERFQSSGVSQIPGPRCCAHPFSIAYVFARPPTKPCPLGAHCPRPFDFALVQETVGHTTAAAAGVHLAVSTFMSYGVWVATANLPRRGLIVTVTSNAGPSPQQQVLRIARRVVQAAR